MLCKAIDHGKISFEEAREKYEEMLDLIDEDHQEVIEAKIAEAEEELNYWDMSKKLVREDYYEEDDDDNPIEDELSEFESFDDVEDDDE
jgi:polyhydroxyalkanoate synthesis regulator phasin